MIAFNISLYSALVFYVVLLRSEYGMNIWKDKLNKTDNGLSMCVQHT